MPVRKKVTVHGRVQGVFFRDTCRRVAQKAGVAGSAENRADGTVEVVLEGEEGAVDEVVDWCRRGTEYSKVERIEISEEEPTGLDGFRIL